MQPGSQTGPVIRTPRLPEKVAPAADESATSPVAGSSGASVGEAAKPFAAKLLGKVDMKRLSVIASAAPTEAAATSPASSTSPPAATAAAAAAFMKRALKGKFDLKKLLDDENAPTRYELQKTIDGLKASLQTRQEETDKV